MRGLTILVLACVLAACDPPTHEQLVEQHKQQIEQERQDQREQSKKDLDKYLHDVEVNW